MPARCHNDSCSIKWREVTTASGPAYEAHVDLDSGDVFSAPSSQPTITCAANGLETMISPDAGNILTKAHGNGLYVGLASAREVQKFDAALAAVGNTTDIAAPSVSTLAAFQSVNNTGRDALCLIRGEFSYYYSVHNAGINVTTGDITTSAPAVALTPFGAQIRARLFANLSWDASPAFALLVDRQDIGGLVDLPDVGPSANVQFKSRKSDFTYWLPYVVPAGAYITWDDHAFHDGPDQRVNLLMGAPIEEGPRGYRIERFQVVMIPLNVLP